MKSLSRISIFVASVLLLLNVLLPFSSKWGDSFYTYLFLFLSYLIYGFIERPVPRNLSFTRVNFRLLKLLNITTLIGSIFFIIDKVLVRNIDYSQGISAARYAMSTGADVTSVSSVYSVMGYILISSSFLSIPYLVIYWESFMEKKRLKIYTLLLSVAGVMVVSLLTGGRSSLLIFLGFLLSGLYLRSSLGLRMPKFRLKNLFQVALLLTGVLSYIIYVFSDRADLGEIEPQEYAEIAIDHLHGEFTSDYQLESDNTFIVSNYYFGIILVAYFTHSTWTMDGVLAMKDSQKYGSAIFFSWKRLMSKSGLVDPPDNWKFSGFFVPMIGAFIYDFGLIGMLYFILFFLCLNQFSIFLLRRGLGLLSISVFSLYYFTLVSSTFLVSTDVLMIPMIFLYLTFIVPIVNILAKIKA